jgi:hypothetical protein
VLLMVFYSVIVILFLKLVRLAAGTQVKWNRLDGHILASSHMDSVLIWDRRVCIITLFIGISLPTG